MERMEVFYQEKISHLSLDEQLQLVMLIIEGIRKKLRQQDAEPDISNSKPNISE